jgi:hypothetical protein
VPWVFIKTIGGGVQRTFVDDLEEIRDRLVSVEEAVESGSADNLPATVARIDREEMNKKLRERIAKAPQPKTERTRVAQYQAKGLELAGPAKFEPGHLVVVDNSHKWEDGLAGIVINHELAGDIYYYHRYKLEFPLMDRSGEFNQEELKPDWWFQHHVLGEPLGTWYRVKRLVVAAWDSMKGEGCGSLL